MVISAVLIVLVASTISGCCGIGGTPTITPTSTPGTPTSTHTNTNTGKGNADVPAVVSGNTITINGVKTDQSGEQNSTYFDLEEGAYLVTWTNTGSFGNIFTTTVETEDGNGMGIISLMDDTKGSSVLVVGGFMTPAGRYHLNVGNGGTYSVTISKPTSGDAVPKTYTLSKGEGMGKAVQLNAGEVKIGIKYSVSPTGTTFISLYDVEGNSVLGYGGGNNPTERTATITTPGVYLLDVTLSGNTGGEVTVSQ